MDRWEGKVALVTGASSGIGAAIAQELAKSGVKVFAVARRIIKLEQLKQNTKNVKGEIIPLKADISNEEDIVAAFKKVKETFGTIHILVNNAGIGRLATLQDGKTAYFRDTFDVNVLGLTICTQQALKLMKESKVDDGHIININGVTGHYVPNFPQPILNVAPASKHAVTALTESLRQELNFLKSKIRVTSISPGSTESELLNAMQGESGVTFEKGMTDAITAAPTLKAKDVADAVIFVLSRPAHVQISELMVRPIGEML